MEGKGRIASEKELLEWAEMSDTEFYFRYLKDANEEELEAFLKLVPEFLEDEE